VIKRLARDIAMNYNRRSQQPGGRESSPAGLRKHHKLSSVRPAGQALLVAAAVLLPAFFFLYGLGSYPLLDNNEGLHAEIAREMLETGQFIVPHLLGVPYIEKPPLLYWLMALSFHAFGLSEASARAASAVPMMLLGVSLFFFCRHHGHARAGLYATTMLSTSLSVVLVCRTIVFDPLLTALLSFCFLAFLNWYLERRQSWLTISAVLLALSTLEKGGLAVAAAAGIIGVFLWLMRDRAALRAMADRTAIGLFLAVTLLWHIAATLLQDGFAWFYFINEHVLRYFGLREPHDYHSGPPYYYLPRMLIMLLPWTPLLALLIRRPAGTDHAARVIAGFCKAWILFPLLFFSLSQAKAHYYIVVTAPACALLLGIVLEQRLSAGENKMIAYCLGLSMAIGVAGLWTVQYAGRNDWSSPAMVAATAGGLALCITVFCLSGRWIAASRGRPGLCDAAVAIIALLMLPLLVLLLRIVQVKAVSKSSRNVADVIRRYDGGRRAVFLYRDFEDVFSTIPFYLQQKVRVIDSTSQDLQFGCRITKGVDNACVSGAAFESYRARSPVAVVVSKKRLAEFGKALGQDRWHVETVGDKQIFFNR
jgi:4-amino-4-deoxy-L-arabinose transferase-like glycosyltransferase